MMEISQLRLEKVKKLCGSLMGKVAYRLNKSDLDIDVYYIAELRVCSREINEILDKMFVEAKIKEVQKK